MEAPERRDLPEWGWVCIHEGALIGCIFLRQCEGQVGSLESFASNPAAPSEIRDRALNALLAHGIEFAKTIGIGRIVSFSLDRNTLARAKNHGFQELPYTLVALSLS